MSGLPFKETLQMLAGAVSVITVGEGEERTGLTATSVSAFSAEPPTVAFGLNAGSSSWRALQKYARFCVNILAAGQSHIAEDFSGRGGLSGPDRYGRAAWTRLMSGAPVLEGAIANIDCELDEAIARHSHVFVIGRVVALRSNDRHVPLVYWRRNFVALHEATAHPQKPKLVQAIS